ncbi:hypothetical protein IVA82_14285 [Bradyrhizobium sp. 142]|nr:hypothetical protein [Bradyrhizobium sp. 142]
MTGGIDGAERRPAARRSLSPLLSNILVDDLDKELDEATPSTATSICGRGEPASGDGVDHTLRDQAAAAQG